MEKVRARRGGSSTFLHAPCFTLSSDSRVSLTLLFSRLSASSHHHFLQRISQNVLFQVLTDFSLIAFAPPPLPSAFINSESASFSLCFLCLTGANLLFNQPPQKKQRLAEGWHISV